MGRERYMSRLESLYDREQHTRMALYGLSGIGYVTEIKSDNRYERRSD